MRSIVPTLDMYRLTADQADNSAHLHYDELYLQPETGAIDANSPPPWVRLASGGQSLPQHGVQLTHLAQKGGARLVRCASRERSMSREARYV